MINKFLFYDQFCESRQFKVKKNYFVSVRSYIYYMQNAYLMNEFKNTLITVSNSNFQFRFSLNVY